MIKLKPKTDKARKIIALHGTDWEIKQIKSIKPFGDGVINRWYRVGPAQSKSAFYQWVHTTKDRDFEVLE